MRLKKGAITTASQWGDWEDSSLEFEKVLSEIIDNPSGTQEQVKKHSEILHNLYDIAETFRVELRNVKK